ncbi:mandelate racemase/muconate lactonizing enzyme family protein [Actinocrispum wychmicini]|uniref:glucarate dehydratase n=1 Tax=Actinocrispum wychmicini TaxID=1213861 RepID=A0A4R2JRR4_9PSEU|nr:enolase C-terminal domain-like protein [Actinocrispum wychmicini]TCO59896.1 galactonate dehydratase [Actinocrispum wychmicini]
MDVEVHRVRVSDRTTWSMIEVRADGISGWGEFSDAGPGMDLAARTVTGALRTALDDLQARRDGVPLIATPRPIPLYANINRATTERTPDGFRLMAKKAVSVGFSCVKLAPFDGLTGPHRAEEGLACARAVRDEIGPAGLIVDVHELLDDAELDRVLPGLAGLGLVWLEDAAPLGRPERLRRIRDAVGCPLAGGELIGDFADALPAIQAGALDVLMPDVKHAGGAGNALHLARLAREHGLTVSLHNPSGPVATAVSAHVTAALDDTAPLEFMFGEHDSRASLTEPAERVLDGVWWPSGGAGIGVDVVQEGQL